MHAKNRLLNIQCFVQQNNTKLSVNKNRRYLIATAFPSRLNVIYISFQLGHVWPKINLIYLGGVWGRVDRKILSCFRALEPVKIFTLVFQAPLGRFLLCRAGDFRTGK